VAVAALALWAGAGLDAGRLRAMGPGMMPRALAALVGVVGLSLIGLALARAGEPLQRWRWRGPIFLTLGVVGFALAIRPLGLAVAGPVVAMLGGAASPRSRPRELALFAVAITAFCILLFRVLLRLRQGGARARGPAAPGRERGGPVEVGHQGSGGRERQVGEGSARGPWHRPRVTAQEGEGPAARERAPAPGVR